MWFFGRPPSSLYWPRGLRMAPNLILNSKMQIWNTKIKLRYKIKNIKWMLVCHILILKFKIWILEFQIWIWNSKFVFGILYMELRVQKLGAFDSSPIPIIIFRNIEKESWKLNFSNFSKVNSTTDFISQFHVILAFIWCMDDTSQANICQDMKFPNNNSKIFR